MHKLPSMIYKKPISMIKMLVVINSFIITFICIAIIIIAHAHYNMVLRHQYEQIQKTSAYVNVHISTIENLILSFSSLLFKQINHNYSIKNTLSILNLTDIPSCIHSIKWIDFDQNILIDKTDIVYNAQNNPVYKNILKNTFDSILLKFNHSYIRSLNNDRIMVFVIKNQDDNRPYSALIIEISSDNIISSLHAAITNLDIELTVINKADYITQQAIFDTIISNNAPFNTSPYLYMFHDVPNTPYVIKINYNAKILLNNNRNFIQNFAVLFFTYITLIITINILLYIAMLRNLIKATQEIKTHNDCKSPLELGKIFRIIALYKQQHNLINNLKNKLSEKSLEAESALRSKSGFMNSISHELKTPINAILAFSEIISSQTLGKFRNKYYKQYIQEISNEATKLIDIIEGVLDVLRIETNSIKLSFQKIDLHSLIRNIVLDKKIPLEQKNIKIKYKFDINKPCILSLDKQRTKQAIQHILNNAIKFNKNSGSISIKTSSYRNNVFLLIRDTGIGMTCDNIDEAMQEFTQLDKGINRRFEGIGIGLPLAKKLIEIQGGKLKINSNYSQSTTVIIKLSINH